MFSVNSIQSINPSNKFSFRSKKKVVDYPIDDSTTDTLNKNKNENTDNTTQNKALKIALICLGIAGTALLAIAFKKKRLDTNNVDKFIPSKDNFTKPSNKNTRSSNFDSTSTSTSTNKRSFKTETKSDSRVIAPEADIPTTKTEEFVSLNEKQNYILNDRKIKKLELSGNTIIANNADIGEINSSARISFMDNAKAERIISSNEVSASGKTKVRELNAQKVSLSGDSTVKKIKTKAAYISGNTKVDDIETEDISTFNNPTIKKIKTKTAYISENTKVDDIETEDVSIYGNSTVKKLKTKDGHIKDSVKIDEIETENISIYGNSTVKKLKTKDGRIKDSAKIDEIYAETIIIADKAIANEIKSNDVYLLDDVVVNKIEANHFVGIKNNSRVEEINVGNIKGESYTWITNNAKVKKIFSKGPVEIDENACVDEIIIDSSEIAGVTLGQNAKVKKITFKNKNGIVILKDFKGEIPIIENGFTEKSSKATTQTLSEKILQALDKLGFSSLPSIEQVSMKRKEIALKYHPDRFKTPEDKIKNENILKDLNSKLDDIEKEVLS